MKKKEIIKFVVQTLLYLLTALASALGVSSCVKSVKNANSQKATRMEIASPPAPSQGGGAATRIETLASQPCGHAHLCSTCGHAHHCEPCGDRH